MPKQDLLKLPDDFEGNMRALLLRPRYDAAPVVKAGACPKRKASKRR